MKSSRSPDAEAALAATVAGAAALAATAGGPLAMEKAFNESDETVQVIEARLQSFTPLDPVTSIQLHSGQLGMMTIQDNRSLLTRLIAWCKNE